jgi:hypothetical protein
MKLEKLLYSKGEAAEIVGLSIHTISRDCRLGRIQVRHYGRRILIPSTEILRIANEGMSEVKPAA